MTRTTTFYYKLPDGDEINVFASGRVNSMYVDRLYVDMDVKDSTLLPRDVVEAIESEAADRLMSPWVVVYE